VGKGLQRCTTHLDDGVVRPKPRGLGGAAFVHGSDVLHVSRLVGVQVEAVAVEVRPPHHVTQPGRRRSRGGHHQQLFEIRHHGKTWFISCRRLLSSMIRSLYRSITISTAGTKLLLLITSLLGKGTGGEFLGVMKLLWSAVVFDDDLVLLIPRIRQRVDDQQLGFIRHSLDPFDHLLVVLVGDVDAVHFDNPVAFLQAGQLCRTAGVDLA
ncbi:unnamed protein product, partial [Ixodes persulcatus]